MNRALPNVIGARTQLMAHFDFTADALVQPTRRLLASTDALA
jgi:hypothetical protein